MNITLRILSEIDNIRSVEAEIDKLTEQLEISKELYGKILVATLEAVNNSIIHGNLSDINKQVCIKFKFTNIRLTVAVSDEGPGFQYNSIPDPTLPENVKNLHGRGIFIMKSLSDSIKFNISGNEVVMGFKIV